MESIKTPLLKLTTFWTLILFSFYGAVTDSCCFHILAASLTVQKKKSIMQRESCVYIGFETGLTVSCSGGGSSSLSQCTFHFCGRWPSSSSRWRSSSSCAEKASSCTPHTQSYLFGVGSLSIIHSKKLCT